MYHNDGDKRHVMIYSFVIPIPFCFGHQDCYNVRYGSSGMCTYIHITIYVYVSLHITITNCVLRLLENI